MGHGSFDSDPEAGLQPSQDLDEAALAADAVQAPDLCSSYAGHKTGGPIAERVMLALRQARAP